MTCILSRADVDGLVGMADVIEAIELAHVDLSRGHAVQPAPTTMAWAGTAFLPMVAVADRQGLAAVKFLSDIPQNASRGLSVQRSTLMLVSLETGDCEAIIDGEIPTRQRTAAASAVASRHLARPESRVLGLVGTGNLAVEHCKALALVLPIDRVLAWSRSAATVARFAERMRQEHPAIEVEIVDSPRDVVMRADVVCTLTPSREPIILGDWFRPGLHLNAVGAPPRADHREIDSAGMARATVFVDSFATAIKKSGDAVLALADGVVGEDHFRREIGDVIAGTSPGRVRQDEITLYNSVGIGLQDLAIGHLMLARARANGVGLEVSLRGAPPLPKAAASR